MNILHISTGKVFRGGENQVMMLLEGLASIGVENILLCRKNGAFSKKNLPMSCQKETFDPSAFNLLAYTQKIRKLAVQNEVSLIHVHDSFAHTCLFYTYKLTKIKVPSIVTRRSVKPISSLSKAKYNYPKIKYIVGVSKAIVNTVLPAIPLKERLIHIPSAVEIESGPTEILVLPNKKIISCIGHFTEEKNHSGLIAIIEEFNSTWHSDDVHFCLAGDGPLLPEIKKLSAERRVKNISFLGHLEGIDALLKDSYLVVSTSKTEGLGTSLIAALNASVPVVAYDVGGISEYLTHDHNGALVAFGNQTEFVAAIAAMLTNPERYRHLKSNAKKSVESFTKSKMASSYKELYQSIARL